MVHRPNTRLRGMLKQLTGLVVTVGVSALLVIGIAILVLPELPGGDDTLTVLVGDGTGLPTPEDLSGLGAVLVATGTPVDDGVIEQRYAFGEGGAGSDPVWDVTLSFSAGTGSGESLRVRWSWHDDDIGGEIQDVWALFSVRADGFTADHGQCHVDLVRYQAYEETVQAPVLVEDVETSGGVVVVDVPAETHAVNGVDLAGSIACEDVPGRRSGESISFQAVFNVPRPGEG